MEKPAFPVYEGSEPFVFVSYSRQDASDVYPELTQLNAQGVNIWYDEGIGAGTEWRAEVANAIQRSTMCIFFTSPNSVSSDICRKEISYADKEKIPIVAGHLQPTQMPAALDMMLSDRQAIMKYELVTLTYRKKLRATIDAHLRPSELKAARTTTEPRRDSGFTNLPSKSIAVLPFKSLSSNDENVFFSAGVHEDILVNLSKVRDLKVISHTSVMAYADNKTKSLGQIAEELGVGYILEGSVRRAGERVRIAVQLIEAVNDDNLWANNYDRDLDDIFAVQSQVATDVVRELEIVLDSETISRVQAHATNSVLAYDLFTRARNTPLSEKTTGEARALLERAIAEDPEFAVAHAALAKLLFTESMFGGQWDLLKPVAFDHGRKALTLDPLSCEAHEAMGYLLQVEGRLDEAVQEFNTALKLNPNSSFAHQNLFLLRQNSEDRFRSLRFAVELDPLNVESQGLLTNLTLGSYASFEEKKAQLDRLKRLSPDSFVTLLSEAFFHKDSGNPVASFDTALRLLASDPDNILVYSTVFTATFGIAYPPLRKMIKERASAIAPQHDLMYLMRIQECVLLGELTPHERFERQQAVVDEWTAAMPNGLLMAKASAEVAGWCAVTNPGRENAEHQRAEAMQKLSEQMEVNDGQYAPTWKSLLYLELLGLEGRAEEAAAFAQGLLNQLKPGSHSPVAEYLTMHEVRVTTSALLASMKDREGTLSMLEDAFEHGMADVHLLEVYPGYNWLHGDAEFEALREKIRDRNDALIEHIESLDLENRAPFRG